jgi:hypothetical protein
MSELIQYNNIHDKVFYYSRSYNLVIHFPAILSRMSLSEANLVIHFPAILSRMPLAKANFINMLDFIYIEHDIYCNCMHQRNFKLYKCK